MFEEDDTELTEICRHSPGDPNCGSSPQGRYRLEAEHAAAEQAERDRKKQEALKRQEKMQEEIYSRTPDKEKYEILEFKRIGPHLVMKILYPNCVKCSYEGAKVMVFKDVREEDVVKWRVIDPHFRDPSKDRGAKEAPGPSARFPASKEGWAEAIQYAEYHKGQHV